MLQTRTLFLEGELATMRLKTRLQLKYHKAVYWMDSHSDDIIFYALTGGMALIQIILLLGMVL